jgi:hypothetical protein
VLTAQAQSRQSVGLRQTGHELANKSSKIVPLGAPVFSCSINHLAHHCDFD